ncbi:hypothetical protein J4Q44_G00252440 [Coregonus suidteri]|uniref:Uncharacterized protein n=1 Tax=Coregonus suidteri TaxID=861788 RepID=A0AAN8L8D7_9TELE
MEEATEGHRTHLKIGPHQCLQGQTARWSSMQICYNPHLPPYHRAHSYQTSLKGSQRAQTCLEAGHSSASRDYQSGVHVHEATASF